jgi:hypothetical protein
VKKIKNGQHLKIGVKIKNNMGLTKHTLNFRNIKEKCYEIRASLKEEGKGNELEFEKLLDDFMEKYGIFHDTMR